jgi:hypothetical protein
VVGSRGVGASPAPFMCPSYYRLLERRYKLLSERSPVRGREAPGGTHFLSRGLDRASAGTTDSETFRAISESITSEGRCALLPFLAAPRLQ